jgi:hypothetical protein
MALEQDDRLARRNLERGSVSPPVLSRGRARAWRDPVPVRAVLFPFAASHTARNGIARGRVVRRPGGSFNPGPPAPAGRLCPRPEWPLLDDEVRVDRVLVRRLERVVPRAGDPRRGVGRLPGRPAPRPPGPLLFPALADDAPLRAGSPLRPCGAGLRRLGLVRCRDPEGHAVVREDVAEPLARPAGAHEDDHAPPRRAVCRELAQEVEDAAPVVARGLAGEGDRGLARHAQLREPDVGPLELGEDRRGIEEDLPRPRQRAAGRGAPARLHLGDRAEELLARPVWLVHDADRSARVGREVGRRREEDAGERLDARDVLSRLEPVQAVGPVTRLRRVREPVAPQRGRDREPLALARAERSLDHRRDDRLPDPVDRPLRVHVEGANRGDLVPVELDPVRALRARRENVEDPAPPRELARLGEHLLVPVPARHRGREERFEVHALAHAQPRGVRGEPLGRGKRRREGPGRGDQPVP